MQPPSHDSPADRFVLAIFALILGALASWMYWVAHRFDQQPAGWLRILYVIVDDFIFAVFLFAALLLLKAVFAPAWLDRFLIFAFQNLKHAILLIGVLVFASVLFVSIMANLR